MSDINFIVKISLNFVNNVDKMSNYFNKPIVIDVAREKIYVLSGHNKDNVTAEIFEPLDEVLDHLPTGSNYLCKTNMVESKNQYFILER